MNDNQFDSLRVELSPVEVTALGEILKSYFQVNPDDRSPRFWTGNQLLKVLIPNLDVGVNYESTNS